MSMKFSFFAAFLASIFFLGAAWPAVADDTNVTVQPWGAPEVKIFDPTKSPGAAADPTKPGDLPGPPVDGNGTPLVPANESAVAVAGIDTNFTVDTSAPDMNGNVKVAGVGVTITGKTIIYLPKDANQQLKDHESGHDALYKNEYDKKARQKLDEAAKTVVGKRFGSADDAKKAVEKALDDRGDGALLKQMGVSGDKYDALTNHGRNDKVDPETNKAVDTPTGIAMTKAERDTAPPAGANPSAPNTSRACSE